jgi:hypothetical protein
LEHRLILAYGALILSGALLTAVIVFGSRRRRAYYRGQKRAKKSRERAEKDKRSARSNS